MTEAKLMLELAVMLFQRDKLTLGQAGKLAGMDQIQFQLLLGSRKIPIHYGVYLSGPRCRLLSLGSRSSVERMPARVMLHRRRRKAIPEYDHGTDQ